MDKLYWLDEIKLQERTKVGDKAFYLSRISQRGYPVVPGFVVSADVLREFLDTLNSSEALVADLPYSSLHLDVGNWRQLQQVANRLRQEIITATVPPQWVNKILKAARKWETASLIFRPTLVIPSAAHEVGNIYGLLESQVCHCDEDAIALALKRTWSQLFRARSLLYWQSNGIDLQGINLAILVQPLRNAIASGLVNCHSWELEIQATWGLGMAIAQGEVQPDLYYIQRQTGAVLNRHLGNKMLAYRFDDASSEVSVQPSPSSLLVKDNTCLSAYILEEAQQKQYALQEEYLQQLIQLGNQLVSELGTNFALEWTIPEQPADSKLYLTQVSSTQFLIDDTHEIQGLGAAVGQVIANAYVISQHKPEQVPRGVILVTQAVAPNWLPILQKAAGIITEYGGLTSHGAILARELGIPAVVSVAGATALIQTGEKLLMDGNKGKIYRLSSQESRVKSQESIVNSQPSTVNRQLSTVNSQQLTVSRQPSTVTSQPSVIATQLLVNLSQSNLIEQVQNLPVDGVGLLRSELMVLTLLAGQHPYTWLESGRQEELLERWYEEVLHFVSGFAPRPVFYRSLDWRSHELPSLNHNLPSSPQSVLGERGTLSYLRNPQLFELELAALAAVQKAGYSNLLLILPFVRSVEEFSFCRQKVEQAGLTQVPQFQLWIMAEVPSVLFLLPEYVQAGVQGISIGTNDLTQLLLGVDREQGQLARGLDERHPALMRAIAQLIQMAKQAGIPCSICGQGPALYPEIINQLVKWGITSISVEPEAIERTHHAIARAEQQLLLEAARQQINS